MSRPGAEWPVGLHSGVDPASNSCPCEPPWINPDRHAELQAKHSRLIGLSERSQDVEVKELLFPAASLVKSSEDDVGTAHELLESTRTQMLSDRNRRKLNSLLRGIKLEMPLRQNLLRGALGQLSRAGTLSPADVALVEGLQERLDDVWDYLRSCGPDWRGSARRIEATLPIGTGTRVAVDCHVLAGKALGAHLAAGYPAQAGGSEPCGVRYFRAPDLALSGLSNSKGQLLYAGLSHGFFHAHELSGEGVAGLSDDALKSVLFEYRRRLVGRLYASNPVPSSMLRPALEIIEGQPQAECERIRRMSRDELALWARSLRLEAGRTAHLDTMNVSLFADGPRSALAYAGMDVDVGLFSIALLGPEDVESWRFQHDCHVRSEPVELKFDGCDWYADSGLLNASFRVRQCALSVSPERPGLYRCPADGRREAERLLGAMDSPSPGGDAKAWLDDAKATISESRDTLAQMMQTHDRVSCRSGGSHPAALTMARRLAWQKDDLERLVKDARTFEDATRQLKTLWAEAGDWPAGDPGHRMAAARLALIGFLMGETPMLSCASGRDLIAPLEQEVRFIATFADNQGGHLPPLNLPAELYRDARGAFALP